MKTLRLDVWEVKPEKPRLRWFGRVQRSISRRLLRLEVAGRRSGGGMDLWVEGERRHGARGCARRG